MLGSLISESNLVEMLTEFIISFVKSGNYPDGPSLTSLSILLDPLLLTLIAEKVSELPYF